MLKILVFCITVLLMTSVVVKLADIMVDTIEQVTEDVRNGN